MTSGKDQSAQPALCLQESFSTVCNWNAMGGGWGFCFYGSRRCQHLRPNGYANLNRRNKEAYKTNMCQLSLGRWCKINDSVSNNKLCHSWTSHVWWGGMRDWRALETPCTMGTSHACSWIIFQMYWLFRVPISCRIAKDFAQQKMVLFWAFCQPPNGF